MWRGERETIDPLKVDEEYKALKKQDLSQEQLVRLLASANVHHDLLVRHINRLDRQFRLLKEGYPNEGASPVGFDLEVPPGDTTFVVTRTQMIFRGQRLAVEPECAPFFDIHDLRIGRNSEFIACNPIAATFFPAIPKDAEDFERIASWVRMKIDVAQIGQDICILVHNHDDVPHRFQAALWGYYL